MQTVSCDWWSTGSDQSNEYVESTIADPVLKDRIHSAWRWPATSPECCTIVGPQLEDYL